MELDSSWGSDQPAGARARNLARALFPVHPYLIALFPVLSSLAANIQVIPLPLPLATGLRQVPTHVRVLMHGFSEVVSTIIHPGMLHIATAGSGYGKTFLKMSSDRALFPGLVLFPRTAVTAASKPAAVNGSDR